jgi:hypothetical protein
MGENMFYECINRLLVPLWVSEDNLSFSEKEKLRICRELAINNRTIVDLSIFDKITRKEIKENLVELALVYDLKVEFEND